MCGIFIAIHKSDNLLEESLPLYSRALSDLSFRGPDLKIERLMGRNIYFGQTILSLTGDVTKSDGSHLYSHSKRYQLAFNGEIYNYRQLYTEHLSDLSIDQECMTDTEVLINLHDRLPKERIPDQLDGMYAYTVFDLKDNRLIINRDPQGEKTLFVFENRDHIYIASEIKPLERVCNLELDPQVLRDYFSTRHFMFETRTLFRNIRQLRPGQMEELDLAKFSWRTVERLRLSSFIDPVRYLGNQNRSLEDLTDELDALMEKSVKEMVPYNRKFASVVSGGVDSSLISAYGVKHGHPDILIAVNHLGKDQISHDLRDFEKYFKRPVTILNADPVVYSRELINAQKALSSPIFSHSFVGQSLQSQFVRGQGCVALFGGEGADELFGGYRAYLEADRRQLESRFSLSPYSSFTPPEINFKLNDFALIEEELAKLWGDAKECFGHVADKSERAAHAMMFCDLSYQVPSVGLRGADIMSMMWSVETRSVFMRREIVRFALNLPQNFKADINEKNPIWANKKILKNLFKRYFGQELILPKQGFSGFPNEAGLYLGPPERFLTIDFLEIDQNSFDFHQLPISIQWKLINIEYFLRSRVK